MNKINRFLGTLLATLFATVICLNANAYSFMVDDLFYDINPDGISVTVTFENGPNKQANTPANLPSNLPMEGSTLIIPSSVTYEGVTYTVTAIGMWAFELYPIITDLNITNVIIPNTVTSIGTLAFLGCNTLTSITIPNSVTSIEDDAFGGCNFTSLFIPSSVVNIGNGAFSGCGNTTTIIVDDENPVYDSRDNCNAIIETATNTLLYGCKNTVIPSSVTAIGGGAFSGCSELTSIAIPNSVTSIGGGAFSGCSNLTSIAIPNTVTSIGGSAFSNCSSLTSIALPNSISTIDFYTFSGCSNLASIALPNTISLIKNFAFSNCTSLSSITLTGYGPWVYSRNQHYGLFLIINQIKEVNIGCNITTLGDFKFNPDVVNCYGQTPPTCTANTFASYDGQLHVPTTAAAAYFTAPYWENFTNLIIDLTTKIEFDDSSADLFLNGQQQLTATVTPQGSSVTWDTTDPAVATVDNNGIVTANGVGQCYIYATISSVPAVYDRCAINVSYPQITSITLSESELEFKQVGETATLTATTTPEIPSLQPTWTSSDESVATVDANGVVTATGKGECFITATMLNKSATCHVVVTGNVLITLDQHELAIDINQIATLTPTCSPVETELKVTSSDPSIANARFAIQDGATIIQVLGITKGVATITVTSTDGTATPDSCIVRVAMPTGDANGDGELDVRDITSLIDIIMNSSKNPNADLNGDGEVDVCDITALIDIIMNS